MGSESDNNFKRPPVDRQHENVDALIDCVMKDVGFSQGKPVAAFTIYKCLLHWKSLETEMTSVFDRLIQMIGSAIKDQDDNEHMAYWLSNTSTLLFLLQRSLKPAGGPGGSPARKPPQPTSPFGRMTMGCPKQPGGIECGYVVMRYMKEIVMDSEVTFMKKWASKNRNLICTKVELDEVRFETLGHIKSFL